MALDFDILEQPQEQPANPVMPDPEEPVPETPLYSC